MNFKGIPVNAQTPAPATPAATLGQTLRWTEDIGMFALDRPIEVSCVHATSFCKQHCFNNKLERAFGHAMGPKDKKNEQAWNGNGTASLASSLSRKHRQTARARFMTRGEALGTYQDIDRVAAILEATPDTTWWMPTRAWRNKDLFAEAQNRLSCFPNLRILASMDPSNTQEDWDHVKDLNLSTMYFDKNTAPATAPTGSRWFKCPKTHKKLKGRCSTCKAGCFTTRRRVDVHLLQH